MNVLKICRICLVTDVKMFNLQEYPLQTYFEPFIGTNPLCILELPPYACYECAALIRKFHYFKEKCHKGQTTLYNILHEDGELSINNVKHIDRNKLKLSSVLNKVCQDVWDNGMIIDNDVQSPNVKVEVNDLSQTTQQTESNSDILMKDVKSEDDYADFEPGDSASSDDEPLVFHKNFKENEEKKKKDKRYVKKKSKDIKMELESNVKETQTRAIEKSKNEPAKEKAIPIEAEDNNAKRKRGRPKKGELQKEKVNSEEEPKQKKFIKNAGDILADDADLEQYVTIINLSVEEQLLEVEKRKESSNYLNAQFQCNLCNRGFIDTDAWKHHLSKHRPVPGDVACTICHIRFKSKRGLQKHASNHEKKYACKSCPYVSKTTSQAKQHQRWHKGVTYKCPYCDEISTKWTSHLSHVRIKHPSEFICGACGYSFVSRLGLTMHRSMMHRDLDEQKKEEGKEVAPYCAECDVQFTSVEAWKRHMVISAKHVQDKDANNGCRACGETFKTSEELRVHHRKEHVRKRPKNYGKKPSNMTWPTKCEHCAEEIPNAREYWTHFRRVHPDKKYPIQKSYICEICGKGYRGNAFLVYHKRTHFEERAFKCDKCPKAFFNRNNLLMHEKTHSENRPYPCSVCFKAFKSKGALDRHFRSHTGVKPYECEFCGKAFGQSNSRKLHVRTVHLKLPAPYVSKSRLERRRAQNKDPNQQAFAQPYTGEGLL